MEALVGDPKRVALVAADLVAHFEKRLEAMDGKAMVVCMSRRICVALFAGARISPLISALRYFAACARKPTRGSSLKIFCMPAVSVQTSSQIVGTTVTQI